MKRGGGTAQKGYVQEYVRIAVRPLVDLSIQAIRENVHHYYKRDKGFVDFKGILPGTLYDTLFLGDDPDIWLSRADKRMAMLAGGLPSQKTDEAMKADLVTKWAKQSDMLEEAKQDRQKE